MGRATTYSEVSDSPQTRCTTCKTVFEVSAELLSSSDTRVRCGECFNIFDALANLRTADDTLDTAGALSDATGGDPEPDDTSLDLSSAISPYDDETYSPTLLADHEAAALDVTYSDFDLFSGEAALPEVSYLDRGPEPAELDFESVDIDHDETFSDTLFAQDETIDTGPLDPDATVPDDFVARVSTSAAELDEPDFLFDDATVEPIDFNYHDATLGEVGFDETIDSSRQAQTRPTSEELDGALDREDTAAVVQPDDGAEDSRTATSDAQADSDSIAEIETPDRSILRRILLPTILMLVLVMLAGSLYLISHRDTLYNSSGARRILEPLCSLAACTVPSRVDLNSLRMLARDVSSHPVIPDALIMKIAFVNEADFAQRYPVLVALLRDRVGQLVAERDFQPSNYRDDWQPGATIGANERLDIVLEVNDPGPDAESIVFEFRAAAE